MTKKSNLQIYTFEAGEATHAIRVLMKDGSPWFIAMDLAKALDYSDAEAMTRRLDDEEKQNLQIVGFGPRGATVISESGVYTAVLTSQKAEARAFKHWLTHEVLPSIARTGVYVDANNRMGETLGAATDGAISVEQGGGDLALAMRHVAQALIGMTERMDRVERDQAQSMRSMRQELSRTVGRIVRVNKAQRASNKNLDPNRPLSEDDVERFKYLLGTGATAKQIARSLNRTYEVIRRFMDTNQDLVIRTLQHSLL